MANHFDIPEEVEKRIRLRNKVCVYCGKKMKQYKNIKGCFRDKATIEHISYNGPFYWDNGKGVKEEHLAICCGSCNSSRGPKKISNWFKLEYCIKNNINEKTVAKVIKNYLKNNPLK